MSYNNGKISETDPVSITDVRSVLGSPSGDVGQLCASTAVNMWAKYKPVALAEIVPLRSVAWWRGTSGKCGMDIATYNNLTSLFTALSGGLHAWGREMVTGGATAPYRLADFRGYNHNAVNPVGDIGGTSYTIDSTGSITVAFDIEAVGSDNITLYDIAIGNTSLSEFYLGVYCYGGTGSVSSFYCTSTQKVGSATSLTIKVEGLTNSYAGSYTLVPFFSSVPLSLNGSASAGVFLSANKSPVGITIGATGSLVYLYAMGNWANEPHTSVEWSVLATNEGTSSYSFTYSVYLYRRTTEDYAAGELVKTFLLNQSVTVSAGERDTTKYSETTSVSGYSQEYEYYLALTPTAAQTVTTYYPLEDYYPE